MEGYKSFNKDFTNNMGIKMEVLKLYTTTLEPKVKNSGFHFCENLEDTLRYFNGLDEDIVICKVRAVGSISYYYDEWYDYDIYSTDKIYIEKILSRDEIIRYVDGLNSLRFIRFIQGFRLSSEELAYFKRKYADKSAVINHLRFYQEGDLEIFNKDYKRKRKLLI